MYFYTIEKLPLLACRRLVTSCIAGNGSLLRESLEATHNSSFHGNVTHSLFSHRLLALVSLDYFILTISLVQ